uniref:Large ribosomal subunit protein uL23c n=1 Tax=Pseudochlorodesmis sp. HV01306a TaxID=2358488 RepID=A0A386AY26_9CHLO|nr:ribosomal protein L23 [Pseudochlorodesmis sp. HV01306a]
MSQNFAKQQEGFIEQSKIKLNQKLFDFLKKPVITDKTTKLIEQKIYTFDVDAQLTKKQIKEIFENFYGVPVKSVKTHRILKKKKRSFTYNKFKPIKRALLCFENQQEISILNNLIPNNSN